jgi:hypothetical protein
MIGLYFAESQVPELAPFSEAQRRWLLHIALQDLKRAAPLVALLPVLLTILCACFGALASVELFKSIRHATGVASLEAETSISMFVSLGGSIVGGAWGD